jgi:hypothetical protein
MAVDLPAPFGPRKEDLPRYFEIEIFQGLHGFYQQV